MNATIISRTTTSFTLQVEIPYNGSMLDFDEALEDRLNEAGVVATAEGLQQFDTDGSPITVGPVKFTTKGRVEKDYQTPYVVATVARHVYRSPQGGPTYCPLDRAPHRGQLHPRFAKVVSHKYAEFSSPRVRVDLEENHGREVSRCLIQDLAGAVAAAAQVKEEDGSYALPKFDEPPATVASDRLESLLQVDARRPRARLRLCDPGLAGPGDGAGLPAPSVGTPAPIGSHPNDRVSPDAPPTLQKGYTLIRKWLHFRRKMRREGACSQRWGGCRRPS